MLGLIILIATATALVVGLYVGGIVREALRPPRATAGWAMGRGQPSSPQDLGLSAKEWLLKRGRAQLPVWEIELDEDPSGLSIVVVHGWGRSRIDSLVRIAPFLECASRVVLLDLRGHGDASGRTNLGDGEEADVAALIDRLPNGPVVLVGHSLGATIALRVATETNVRDRIVGVVAIAPYDTVRTPLRNRVTARELPAGPLLSLALVWLRALGVRPLSTVAAARALKCPLLVIHGDRDRIAPPEEGRAIAEAGRGTFLLIEGVEHADHETREPKRVADACAAFLASISTSATIKSDVQPTSCTSHQQT